MTEPDDPAGRWDGTDPWGAHDEIRSALSNADLKAFDKWLEAARVRDLANRAAALFVKHPDVDIEADVDGDALGALPDADLGEIFVYQDDTKTLRRARGDVDVPAQTPIIPPKLADAARAHHDFSESLDCPECADYKAALQFAIRRLVRLEAVEPAARGPEHADAIDAATQDFKTSRSDFELCTKLLCGIGRRLEDPTPQVNLWATVTFDVDGVFDDWGLPVGLSDRATALRPTTDCPACDHICDHLGRELAAVDHYVEILQLPATTRRDRSPALDLPAGVKKQADLTLEQFEEISTEQLREYIAEHEHNVELLTELLAKCEQLRCPDLSEDLSTEPIPTPLLDPATAVLASGPSDRGEPAGSDTQPPTKQWYPSLFKSLIIAGIVIVFGGLAWLVVGALGGDDADPDVSSPSDESPGDEAPNGPPVGGTDGADADGSDADGELDSDQFADQLGESAVGQATASAADAFAGGAGDLDCVADEMFLSVADLDDLDFLAQPDVAGWPPGLLDTYADALEFCFPLRPYYLDRFGQFPYVRDFCPQDMTDRILSVYSWKYLLELGILDPASSLAIQTTFDVFVEAGYEAEGCFLDES